MEVILGWVLAAFLVGYPLAAPWRKGFIVGWLLIWFSLWVLFFLRADYESEHFEKGIVSGSLLIGIAIFAFSIASFVRVIGRRLTQWQRRRHGGR
jgi:MFS family permease